MSGGKTYNWPDLILKTSCGRLSHHYKWPMFLYFTKTLMGKGFTEFLFSVAIEVCSIFCKKHLQYAINNIKYSA